MARPLSCLGLLGPDRYAPQKEGARDLPLSQLSLRAKPETAEALALQRRLRYSVGGLSDLSEFATVLDQGSSSSCVANAWEGALLIQSRILGFAGKISELGSRLFGYFNARSEHGAQFTDTGTFLRSYARALKNVGRCPESEWKFNLKKVNRRPSIRAYQQAHAMKGIRGYYRIYDTGSARVDAICSAIDAGHPVVFGLRVDSAFLEHDGPILVEGVRGDIVGGHAMCCVGYDYREGRVIFKILNSWGTSWRKDGFCWFTEDLMTSSGLEDLWCASLEV